MNRLFFMILFLFFACAVCFGQTSYKGLTPGKSTRVDVELTLGKPVKEHSTTLIEYGPQPQTGKLFVQYRPESGVVERIEFLCRTVNSSCDHLTRSLGLDTSAVANPWSYSGDATGRMVNYYGAPKYFVATLDNDSEGSILSLTPLRIALYSPELYNVAAAKAREEIAKEPQQLSVVSVRFFEGPDGTPEFSDRIYRRRFAGESARFIYYEITLRYPVASGAPLAITALWSRDGPMEPQKRVLNTNYFGIGTEYTQGIGSMDGRQFSQRKGKWTVEFSIDGRKVAVGSFEIY